MSSLHVLTFSEPLRQSSRCDFDAEGVPDHYDPGTDDLPLVIREHFQLPLNQRFQILDDIGKIRRRSPRIETQISLPVLLKLLLPNLWRSAGQIPGGTDGVQTILPLLNRIAHSKKACCHFRDHLGNLALRRSVGALWLSHSWPPTD